MIDFVIEFLKNEQEVLLESGQLHDAHSVEWAIQVLDRANKQLNKVSLSNSAENAMWNARTKSEQLSVDDIAHEIWATAQLMPNEGIENGVSRIKQLLEDMLSKIRNTNISTNNSAAVAKEYSIIELLDNCNQFNNTTNFRFVMVKDENGQPCSPSGRKTNDYANSLKHFAKLLIL